MYVLCSISRIPMSEQKPCSPPAPVRPSFPSHTILHVVSPQSRPRNRPSGWRQTVEFATPLMLHLAHSCVTNTNQPSPLLVWDWPARHSGRWLGLLVHLALSQRYAKQCGCHLTAPLSGRDISRRHFDPASLAPRMDPRWLPTGREGRGRGRGRGKGIRMGTKAKSLSPAYEDIPAQSVARRLPAARKTGCSWSE